MSCHQVTGIGYHHRSATAITGALLSADPPHQLGDELVLPRPGHGRPGDARPLDRDLPTFVDRDKGPAICDWMRAARDSGGFLLLVGDSSVGKTRLLYEAAREVLGDFTVLVPDLGDGDLINKIAEATLPLPRLIVWLDELQRFLDGPYLTPGSIPITAATVRHLLDCPTPVIVVGTLLPQYTIQLRADRWLAQSRYPNAVDILDNRRLHRVSLDTFSADERKAAARLASQDPRLAEVLVGAPTLVYRYENATQEQQAILHAAIDARGLGIQVPLTEQLLTAAARSYLTTRGDIFRLAESAYHRLLYRYAEPLYRRLTDAGNKHASDDLVSLLTKQGRMDEVIELLRARADAGDGRNIRAVLKSERDRFAPAGRLGNDRDVRLGDRKARTPRRTSA